MIIDNKTKLFLSNKLNFSSTHISRLEKNADLMSRTLGLLLLFKRSPNQDEIKSFVQDQLQKIRNSLNNSRFSGNIAMRNARAEYYTFQRTEG